MQTAAYEQSPSDQEGLPGSIGWDTVGEQKQGIFCPSYSQRCLVSRNQDFGQDAVLWGRNEKAGYFVLICMLIHFCWKFVWLL